MSPSALYIWRPRRSPLYVVFRGSVSNNQLYFPPLPPYQRIAISLGFRYESVLGELLPNKALHWLNRPSI
jgi:hypothetical protein